MLTNVIGATAEATERANRDPAQLVELGERAHALAVVESLHWTTPLWWLRDPGLSSLAYHGNVPCDGRA